MFSSSFAEDIKVKVGGLFDFQGAVTNRDETKLEEGKDKVTTSLHNDNFGLLSSGNIFLDVSNNINDDISYGAKIAVSATTRNNRQVPTFLYFTSQIGKLELGSNKTAFKALGVGGYTNACSSDFSNWIELDPNKKNVIYIDSPISFLDSKMRTKDQTEYSRKITYYSPEFAGLQFGLSYIPDLSNTGYGLPGDKTYYSITNYFYTEEDKDGVKSVGKTKKVPYEFSVKDGVAGGVSFKHAFDNDMSIKMAFVAERGNVIVKQEKKEDDTKVNDIKEKDKKIEDLKMSETDIVKYQGAKFTDLMSYMVGGEVKFKDFSLAVSYTNAGDSFTSKELDGDNNKSNCFIVGGRYNFNDLGTSISYFTSDNKKQKLDAITFALDYKLAQGITPYAEFTKYETDGSNPAKPTEKDTQNGSVFILGAKLAF